MARSGFSRSTVFSTLISTLFFFHLPLTIKSPPLWTKVLLYYTDSKSYTLVIGNALPLNRSAKDIFGTLMIARREKLNMVGNI